MASSMYAVLSAILLPLAMATGSAVLPRMPPVAMDLIERGKCYFIFAASTTFSHLKY
jgi:hypothetical protein